MSAIRELIARIGGFGARRGRSSGLDDELRFHLEMMEKELRRQGLDAEGARREARVRLGGMTQIADAYADQRTLPAIETIVQDVRFALRMLRRTPGFTVVSLLTLALGIGANAAIFSFVDTVLLRPLPYADPDRLVMIGDRTPEGHASNVGYLTFQDIRDRSRSFDAVAAIRSWSPTLVVDGEAERVPAMRVSWTYFSMLGVRPALGRDFRADEDRPERWRVILISDGLWRRRFAADPAAVGRTIRMNDQSYQIVGVLPREFEPLVSTHFYTAAEMWAPLGYDATLPYACRGCQHLKALGRLRRDVQTGQALADLGTIRQQLVTAYPSEYPAGEITIERLQDEIAGSIRRALLVLLAAVGFVLLIACANVANLLLARALNRSREMAVRTALGAGRRRLIRQMLTESTVLAAAGGLLGVCFAALSLQTVAAFAPVSIPRLNHVAIDGPVLAFALLLSVVTGVLFGLAPALRASSFRLRAALASDSRSSVGGGSERLRQLLVIADLALALILLAGAGLMLRSVGRLAQLNPGFTTSGVLTLQFSLIGSAYAEDPAVVAFQERLLERVRALPGVERAALAGQIPLGGNGDKFGFHIQGRQALNVSEDPSVERYSVTPDYFRVMEIPLLRGRLITDADKTTSAPVIVISHTTAATLWPGQDPLGALVRIGSDKPPSRTVVGIVGDVRHEALAAPVTPQMYLPQTQVTDSFLVLVVRSKMANVEALAGPIRGIIRGLDPAVPVYETALLEDLAGKSVADRRFIMGVLGTFAVLALLLAAIGLYGVISYAVAQRTRELGLRVALGAQPRHILRLVFGQGLVAVGGGMIIGGVAALVLVHFMRSLLYEVSPTDPATFLAAVAVLLIVAALAHWLPVRRALRVDPASALRCD